MRIKKVIILVSLLLAVSQMAFAGHRDIFLQFHRKNISGKNTAVNRAPMRLPIEVVYDSDTHEIEVTEDEAIEADVFLYNANGTLEGYSSTLNTDFYVFTSGTYTIQIQGDGWYAEGEIEV